MSRMAEAAIERQELIDRATTTPEDRRAIARAAAALVAALDTGAPGYEVGALLTDLTDAVLDRALGCPVGQARTGLRCTRERGHLGGCAFDDPAWRATIAPPAEASRPPEPCCPCVIHGEPCCFDHEHGDLEVAR